jgi:integrase
MPRPLTDVLIRSLQPPTEGRLELADATCRRLWLRVTTQGSKSFAFRYRAQGAPRVERLTLGKYPDVSLRDARTRADKLRAQIAAGKNPSAHRRERSARSFAALAERYLNEHARRHKRSAAKDERNLRLHILPRRAERDFASITRADVIALIERLVGAGKPVLANHVHALISGIFGFAMDVDLASTNPAARLRKRGAANVRDRTLSDAEIQLFWQRITEIEPRSVVLALRLVLATGCRPGEAPAWLTPSWNPTATANRLAGPSPLPDQKSAATISCRSHHWQVRWSPRRQRAPTLSCSSRAASAVMPTTSRWQRRWRKCQRCCRTTIVPQPKAGRTIRQHRMISGARLRPGSPLPGCPAKMWRPFSGMCGLM